MNQDKIWDYYQNDNIENFDGSYGRLKFLANKCKNKRVLNIGIGGGVFEKLALKNNIEIYCLDPNRKSIEKIQTLNWKGKISACIFYIFGIKKSGLNLYFEAIVK